MKRPLTEKQKSRLKTLEGKLDKAVQQGDYSVAKALVLDIREILLVAEQHARLCSSKNKLYELAIEQGDFDSAVQGLESNRATLNENTRIYLETTSLLAICYIRKQDIEGAKPYIREVLSNQTVIKSDRRRKAFHSAIIERFNEEVALCTLKGERRPTFDDHDIDNEVQKIIQTLSEDELYSRIGQYSPRSTKDLIFLVYDFSTKQLPSNEKRALPSPDQKVQDAEIGLTVFKSVKRVLYDSLCNRESEIYQAWFNNGMGIVLSKRYIQTAVISCLVHLGIGVKMIAASIIALVMKFGIEVYCARFKPTGIMEIRQQ